MTTGINIGARYDAEKINEIANELGFESQKLLGAYIESHKTIKGLYLQVEKPSSFRDIDGIVTEIEFDDQTDKFPNNPQAEDILKQLNDKLPGLLCREKYVFKEDATPIVTLNEYLNKKS